MIFEFNKMSSSLSCFYFLGFENALNWTKYFDLFNSLFTFHHFLSKQWTVTKSKSLFNLPIISVFLLLGTIHVFLLKLLLIHFLTFSSFLFIKTKWLLFSLHRSCLYILGLHVFLCIQLTSNRLHRSVPGIVLTKSAD